MQALRGIIQPLSRLTDTPLYMARSAMQAVLKHARLQAGQPVLHCPAQPPLGSGQHLQDILRLRHRQLGGGGRCRRPQIRHEISDRKVRLMPDRRYHRHGGGRYRARYDFFVESPQILQGAAAAAHDDHIGPRSVAKVAQSICNLPRGILPLHRHREQPHMQPAKAAFQDPQHVRDHRPRWGCHETDPPRQRRQAALALLVEQPLCGQARLQLLEPLLQRPGPERFQGIHIELVRAPLLVNADASAGNDCLAVARLRPQVQGILAKADAGNFRLLVLQREVPMAAAGVRSVGHLALNPDIREIAGQQLLERGGK